MVFSTSVTPFVGVWIETFNHKTFHDTMKSHPSWVCGLKLALRANQCKQIKVTPFVGVWIETSAPPYYRRKLKVTPFVGVWIETVNDDKLLIGSVSHTLRGCVD